MQPGVGGVNRPKVSIFFWGEDVVPFHIKNPGLEEKNTRFLLLMEVQGQKYVDSPHK